MTQQSGCMAMSNIGAPTLKESLNTEVNLEGIFIAKELNNAFNDKEVVSIVSIEKN